MAVTGKYATQHTGAYASLTSAGTSVLTFTRLVAGSEATDGSIGTPVKTTIRTRGLVVQGTPQEYEAATLTMHNNVTLLVAPERYPLKAYTAEFILPGDTLLFNGVTFTTQGILSVVAPDGYVVLARVAVSA